MEFVATFASYRNHVLFEQCTDQMSRNLLSNFILKLRSLANECIKENSAIIIISFSEAKRLTSRI